MYFNFLLLIGLKMTYNNNNNNKFISIDRYSSIVETRHVRAQTVSACRSREEKSVGNGRPFVVTEPCADKSNFVINHSIYKYTSIYVCVYIFTSACVCVCVC